MIDQCRGCGSGLLDQVVDLGQQRLSDFRPDPSPPPAFPLQLLLCNSCGLAQLSETVDRNLLYHDGYGYASGVSEQIRADLEGHVKFALGHQPQARMWLDIACNDGTLLGFVPPNIFRVGVDPVLKFAAEAGQRADAIIRGYFDPGIFDTAVFDVITSISVFYDLDDPNEFVAGVAKILAPDGIWIIQQNYLPDMLNGGAFDNICHEHLTYFRLASLEPLLAGHGLQVLYVDRSPINGGCFRTLVAHRDAGRPVDVSVEQMRLDELGMRLDRVDRWKDFDHLITNRVRRLRSLVQEAVKQGEQVMIYAASTRGAVIWQAAGFGPDLIAAAVERQPGKIGRWYSAIGVPIISEEDARIARPDWMLIGPYWLREQILAREAEYLQEGGRMVFPLPKLEIVGAP